MTTGTSSERRRPRAVASMPSTIESLTMDPCQKKAYSTRMTPPQTMPTRTRGEKGDGSEVDNDQTPQQPRQQLPHFRPNKIKETNNLYVGARLAGVSRLVLKNSMVKAFLEEVKTIRVNGHNINQDPTE